MLDGCLLAELNQILRGLRLHSARRDEVKRMVLAGEYDLDRYWAELFGDMKQNAAESLGQLSPL